MNELILSPTDFVAVLNQTLEYAYPSVMIQGELANLRVSKGRWLYFDLKDENSSVKFFGAVTQLPGPLEDGMLVQVRGLPRLHNLYGFSVNVQFMQPVGEGSIKKAAALLEAKLAAEGLFDESRKRLLPVAPARIGLIASEESAAYRDFVKIMNERWVGVDVELANVQVQGEPAVGQVVQAIEYFNEHADPVEVLVITRGGGSPEDLAAFSSEQVTRAVAASRIPTLVAIGHEIDVSLAELAADQRASTPSNAAQLLLPDKREVLARLGDISKGLGHHLQNLVLNEKNAATQFGLDLSQAIQRRLDQTRNQLELRTELLAALSPQAAMKRGYAVVRNLSKDGTVIRSAKHAKQGDELSIQLHDGHLSAKVKGKL